MVATGLDILSSDQELQRLMKGNIGYLCHAASVNSRLVHGITHIAKPLRCQAFSCFLSSTRGFWQ